jgi:uncharacterized membrane protein YGL010W
MCQKKKKTFIPPRTRCRLSLTKVTCFSPSSSSFDSIFSNTFSSKEKPSISNMGRTGLFDLEKHFAFYGSYHRNPINIAIHLLFVWPIFFTALVFLYFTPPFFDLPNFEFLLFGCNFVLVWNFGFLVTLVYSVFYASLDLKAGSLAALCCVVCWVGSCFVAHQLGWSLAWKVNNLVPFWMHFLFESDVNVCFSYVRDRNMFSCSCLYCICVIV